MKLPGLVFFQQCHAILQVLVLFTKTKMFSSIDLGPRISGSLRQIFKRLFKFTKFSMINRSVKILTKSIKNSNLA